MDARVMGMGVLAPLWKCCGEIVMATTTTRRTWSEHKKIAVLTEIARATANGGTIQSVLDKHNISHGMYKRWNEELGPVEATTEPEPPTPKRNVMPGTTQPITTLHDAIGALRVKRDLLNEIIADLERMEKI
jgi:hypothetical protein